MTQDTSSGDLTPKLQVSSLIEATKAINLWYKFVEVSDDFTTELLFNKAARFTPYIQVKASDSSRRGIELLETSNTILGSFHNSGTETRIESFVNPFVINAINHIALKISDIEYGRLTTTGLGLGMVAQETLSLGSRTNAQNVSLGVYSPDGNGVTSVSKLTQAHASGNLTLAFSSSGTGSTNAFVLTSRSGVSSYFTSSGDFAVNTTGPVYTGYSNARTITARGGSGGNFGPGIVELATNAPDASGVMIGAITVAESNGTSRLSSAIEFYASGTTANNRGSHMRFINKTDGGSSFEVARTTNVGQFLIGANTAYSADEVLRVHKATGGRVTLSDVNNACWISSIPDQTSSELAIASNNAEAVRIDKNQRVGIQTTTPTAKLDVGGAQANSAQAVFARGGDINFQLTARNGSAINASGEVVFNFGSEYRHQAYEGILSGGLQFVRGGNAQNMTLNVIADSTKVMSFNQHTNNMFNQLVIAGTTGNLSAQTNVTSAGLVLEPAAAGTDGTDGAFITFRNKGGTRAFSLGMDADGEFKVGGGNIGVGQRIHHDGYSPGTFVNRGSVAWLDVDAARPTGMYSLANSANTASLALFDFANTSGSSARVQMMFGYGGPGGATSQMDMYFRVARDSQTNWDGWGITSNRLWHSGNLVNPVTLSTNYNTPNGTEILAVGSPTVGQSYFTTPSYATNQGDGKTHFGYNNGAGSYDNYIRGRDTIVETGLYFKPTTDTSVGGTRWRIGTGAWGGAGPSALGYTSVAGITTTSAAANQSQLFTFSSDSGQMSVHLDGCLFIGDNPAYNPYSINSSNGGYLVVQNGGAFGGGLYSQTNVTAAYFRANKGQPFGDNTNVGYAFGSDGDTGVFSVGDNNLAGGSGVSLFSDNVQVLKCLLDGATFYKPVTVGKLIKKVATISSASGVAQHDLLDQTCFFHNQPTGNFTVQLTNILQAPFQTVTVELTILQGSTGYIPAAMTVNGTGVSIRWENGTTPTPSNGGLDKATFELIYTGATWLVMGSYRRYS